MDKKIEKLLALYKDKSITIEEKRSIAVKLVDMGVLQTSSTKNIDLLFDNKYLQLRKDYLELRDEYVQISIKCDRAVSDKMLSQVKMGAIEGRVSELLAENNKLKSARKWLTISLIINAVVIIIKILN